ncbi:DNA replication complex GINS protein SLD5 [Dendroctonus ponderosae]|uniref:DNA replication complex GINS protein SLD5 n=1 Tax=Dendroctonus ponderosae TaxID=77166 RepID=J3JTN7_DENPD|nr:DNA replication complex GINS protein SLD5 [Dendroctonus ponderosae]AEE61558.1 unknown [Dendroctonus ponderosae]KAH1001989.1 hypothetical protein HUJ04_005938 [Dendroctonus ponderosae]KAH1001991.1 hypothetical protein HUJ04_005938 [Dendroctonus ponderosae]KAH1004963.1 hypothetical protein HUJ05_005724 [Dendroctonus ponderosae]KAH1004965.1 hypothetical protein HUJ05_005724 [Dendroctonus ponderosae]
MEVDNEGETEMASLELEDDDDLTLEQVLEMMEVAWLNEKFAPEILPHKREIVELLLGQITYLEERLQQLPSTDFKKGIHQMEIDRLRYLLTSYLRLRLEKIETFHKQILLEEEKRADENEALYLSPKELEFAQEFEQDLEAHLAANMNFCPNWQESTATERIVQPNLNSMVFLKAKKDVEGIAIDDGKAESSDLIDLASGSQVLINYNNVASLVKNGDVHLI